VHVPATATKPAPTVKSKSGSTRSARGAAALDELEALLQDAQKSIAELRHNLNAGRRRLVNDVEVSVRNARRELKRTRKAIQADLFPRS
jgi:F0F1-type ATP synthase membrane subunit b/b'